MVVGGNRVCVLDDTVGQGGAIDKRRAERRDCEEGDDDGWAAHDVVRCRFEFV